jgi:hypothetical protein
VRVKFHTKKETIFLIERYFSFDALFNGEPPTLLKIRFWASMNEAVIPSYLRAWKLHHLKADHDLLFRATVSLRIAVLT